jgi:hypothetical protein
MKSSLTRVRLLAAFGIVILCLALFPTLPAAASAPRTLESFLLAAGHEHGARAREVLKKELGNR